MKVRKKRALLLVVLKVKSELSLAWDYVTLQFLQ